MTPKQFVYWLSGYLSCSEQLEIEPIMLEDSLRHIKEALKQVKIVQRSGDIVACFTGDSP